MGILKAPKGSRVRESDHTPTKKDLTKNINWFR